jgi:ribosome-binding protein aMBF1 (putative translation factor)
MKHDNRRTSDAIKILHKRFYAGRPERLAALEEVRANADVAREIHALRRRAGLTQRQLAALVGTAPSVISRLEDADYEGHSMAMLRRIAAALNKRVEIRFVPTHRRLQAA